jgi:hypothetical protein
MRPRGKTAEEENADQILLLYGLGYNFIENLLLQHRFTLQFPEILFQPEN